MKKFCSHCYKENDFQGVSGDTCQFCKKKFVNAFFEAKDIGASKPKPSMRIEDDGIYEEVVIRRLKSPNKNITTRQKINLSTATRNLEQEDFVDELDENEKEFIKQEISASISSDDIIIGTDDGPECMIFDLSKAKNKNG